jgi:hypothetical protein
MSTGYGYQEIQTLARTIYFYRWLIVKKKKKEREREMSNIIRDGDYDSSPRNGSATDRNSAYSIATLTNTLLSTYFNTMACENLSRP